MSLPHILLGMLDQPASGYALKQQFSESLRHFWFADLAQIYPTLHALEKRGEVSSRQQASDKGPPRRIYRRTAAGAERLRDWVNDSPITGRERFPYLAQIMFLGDTADPGQQLEYFKKLAAYFIDKVAALKAIDAGWRGGQDPGEFSDGELFRWFTLDVGIARNQASADWCQRCIELIETRS